MSIPNKAIEYLSAGLPIVTSASGTLPRLLESGDCGVRYQNQNQHELVRIIDDLIRTPNRLAGMSQNANKLFQRRFVAEKVYADMCAFLEAIAEDYRAVPSVRATA